ncbi:MAG: hypothetical protein HY720_02460 [Planctomycetes bacterium]|nr:hypothetical protein [Planctomycetota bacterium]
MKKLILIGVAAVAVLGLAWNAKRIESCWLRLKAKHAQKQEKDLVANWEVHFDEELAKMEDRGKELAKKTYEQRVRAEKTRIELAGLKSREAEYDALVRSFVERMKAAEGNVSGGEPTFAFAGKTFTLPQAEIQLKSYLVELKALSARMEQLSELHAAQTQVVGGYEEAREKLAAKIAELKIKREEYALEKDLLALRSETQKTRDLASRLEECDFEAEQGEMEVLLRAMDDAVIAQKAELAVNGDGTESGATPLSLSETAKRAESDEDRTQIDELRNRYWNEVPAPKSQPR